MFDPFGWRTEMRRIADALDRLIPGAPITSDDPSGDGVDYYDDIRAAKLELLERAKQAGTIAEDAELPNEEAPSTPLK